MAPPPPPPQPHLGHSVHSPLRSNFSEYPHQQQQQPPLGFPLSPQGRWPVHPPQPPPSPPWPPQQPPSHQQAYPPPPPPWVAQQSSPSRASPAAWLDQVQGSRPEDTAQQFNFAWQTQQRSAPPPPQQHEVQAQVDRRGDEPNATHSGPPLQQQAQSKRKEYRCDICGYLCKSLRGVRSHKVRSVQ